ncbi:ABC transporter substrate-binding protein [Bacillus sp. SA1-12]|uniref:ABC transporter substrate-binding protein n=1 Tax=Bacillus sp. SA1-12 TaxID=1455638 RepID=UPI0006259910|nr:sugar ABC transporter substrate-binding protein [Bacillus sp. SA1-12]KKI92488.1 ABC transporter substrate-binding protein [Bacillus sp. SA1-12]
MKKMFLLLLGVMLIGSVFLAGCSKEGASGGSSDKVTLNVALWDENVSEVVDKSIELFKEKHPEVEVKVTYTPYADYWTKLKTSLAGGSGPDIFWMNGPNFYQYASTGLIKDIQPLIDGDKLDTSVYTPALVDLYTYEDKLFGLPYFLDSIGLFYNKKIFDEAGIPYPDETWDWSKVEEVGKKLTDKENGIYGYIASSSNQAGYYNLIHQAGGFIISDDKTKSGFNSPEAQSALQWTKDLMDEGISPSAQAQIETKVNQIFGSGKAAMLPNISVNAPVLHEMLGEDLGVAVLPKGKEQASIVHGLSWVMNEKTKHEELAWELQKVLSGEEAGKWMAESGFSIPAYTGTEDAWLESIPSLDLNVFVDSLEFGVPYPVSKNTAEWQEVENKEIQDALLGKKSVEEATKKIASEMDKILAKESEN